MKTQNRPVAINSISQNIRAKSIMMKQYLYILTLILLCSTGTSMAAAPPSAPIGLCIEHVDGTVCAAPATTSGSTSGVNNLAPKSVNPANFHPGYYMFVGPKDGIAAFNSIKDHQDFVGVKKVYIWKELEIAENVYDFSQIENDLSYLQSIGKRLWIELTIAAWNPNSGPNTPRYMDKDPKYGGNNTPYGAFQMTAGKSAWRTIIWNANTQGRLISLYTALGKRFNNEPYFEGIALGETSIEMGPGWSATNVEAAFKAMSLGAKKAFPDKVVLLQPNFGPPDPSAMRQWLADNGIGIGIPDLVLTSKNINLIYTDFIKHHNAVPTALDVQWDNYERCCNSQGLNFTSAELLAAGATGANPWYMFWEKRESYFSRDVVPATHQYGPLPAATIFYNSIK